MGELSPRASGVPHQRPLRRYERRQDAYKAAGSPLRREIGKSVIKDNTSFVLCNYSTLQTSI